MINANKPRAQNSLHLLSKETGTRLIFPDQGYQISYYGAGELVFLLNYGRFSSPRRRNMVDTRNPFKSPESASAPATPVRGRKRQRSRFWIVSTHLITTAIAMPFVAGVIAMGAVSQGKLQGNQAFLVTLAFQAVGDIAGTYYSLSYLRKATAIRDPQGCTKASIVVFGILALRGTGIERRHVERNQCAPVSMLDSLLRCDLLGVRENHPKRFRRHGKRFGGAVIFDTTMGLLAIRLMTSTTDAPCRDDTGRSQRPR